MGTLLLLTLLTLSPAADAEPVAPGEVAAPAPAPAPGQAPPRKQALPALRGLPWKVIGKAGASSLYGAWVVLWTVALAPAAAGGLLVSLGGSRQPANVPVALGGGALVALAAAVWTVGLACAAGGGALGVVVLVLAELQPGSAGAEAQDLLYVLPRQLFL